PRSTLFPYTTLFRSRTAQEIALSLESRGGSLDAYTSRDSTAYHARVLDADLARALDVITDIVRRPVLRDSDLALERQVVLEEIRDRKSTRLNSSHVS